MFFEHRIGSLGPGLYRIWRMDRRKISKLVGEAGNFEMALDLFETQVKPGDYVYMTRTANCKTRFVLNALGTKRSLIDYRRDVKRILTR